MTYYDRDIATSQPTMQWPSPHHGSVAEYGVSAWPFVQTGSTAADAAAADTVSFDHVTRWVQITATGTEDIRISFADPGESIPTTFYTVQSGDTSPRLELKCVQLFINTDSGAAASWSLIAGLTSITAASFPDISTLTGIAHI